MQDLHSLLLGSRLGLGSSVWLVAFRPRHPYRARTRWLTESGAFSCDRAMAVAVTSPEAAAERLQVFVQSRGMAIRSVERFCLVPQSSTA